ncbi:hypothetical protein GCM10023325_17180 [Sphingomonas lutea]
MCEEFSAKFVVTGGDDRIEPAISRGAGKEIGKRRLVIDQQQARLRHQYLSPRPRECAPATHEVNRRNALLTL